LGLELCSECCAKEKISAPCGGQTIAVHTVINHFTGQTIPGYILDCYWSEWNLCVSFCCGNPAHSRHV